MFKKGDSQIISWVLLVGFVIGLATLVTMWVKDRADTAIYFLNFQKKNH